MGKPPKWGTGQSNRKAASAADSGCDFECVYVCVCMGQLQMAAG